MNKSEKRFLKTVALWVNPVNLILRETKFPMT